MTAATGILMLGNISTGVFAIDVAAEQHDHDGENNEGIGSLQGNSYNPHDAPPMKEHSGSQSPPAGNPRGSAYRVWRWGMVGSRGMVGSI